MFVINSPSNPSGSVYTLDELKALGEVLRKHPKIIIATDDMYEHILLSGGKFVNILNACPDLYARTMVLNGVSKAYSMTGWRIGFLGAPEAIARACNKMQGQITSGANCIAQRAVITALEASPTKVQYMIDEFKVRRDLILGLLKDIDGFTCNTPEGAFYVFPDVTAFFGKTLNGTLIKNATDFSLYLLEAALVATVTGDAFGNPNCIRISYAASQDQIIEAISRIKKAVS